MTRTWSQVSGPAVTISNANQATTTFTPTFNDFQDMYIDFYRFASIGAIMSSPATIR